MTSEYLTELKAWAKDNGQHHALELIREIDKARADRDKYALLWRRAMQSGKGAG